MTAHKNNNRSFLSRIFSNGQTAAASELGKGQARKVLMTAAENFHILAVKDVMVPRAEIIAIDKDTPLNELTTAFLSAGHSRLPVFQGTLDDPLGMVHIKDLLPYLALNAKGRSSENYPKRTVIAKILRPVLFVPPSMRADALLRKMQAGRNHMAIVVDEYGGTDGIVTLEDLIEPIVGDIEDEHDDAEPEIVTLSGANGAQYWEADARAEIEDFEAAIGRDIASSEEDEDFETLGGLVFSLAGRVPERGEIIRHPAGIEFEILDADPRRIKKMRIRPAGSDSGHTPGGGKTA